MANLNLSNGGPALNAAMISQISEQAWAAQSNTLRVTDSPRKSTLRAGMSAAKAALRILVLCLRLWIQDVTKEEKNMNHLLLTMYLKLQNLASREEGQDLVEYALVICLISLAAITGVNYVATAVTTVFSNISTSLA
jgi:pilus assembly protein Flp/PilA